MSVSLPSCQEKRSSTVVHVDIFPTLQELCWLLLFHRTPPQHHRDPESPKCSTNSSQWELDTREQLVLFNPVQQICIYSVSTLCHHYARHGMTRSKKILKEFTI